MSQCTYHVKHLRSFHRFVMPLFLACSLLFIVVPSVLASPRISSLVGPKKYYLALGDSLAFGYQPDFSFSHGYVDDFYNNLQGKGVKSLADLGCPDETSVTFISGGCPYPFMRKFPYMGAQLKAALVYLALFRGKVSPVTLDIGATDIEQDINRSTCAIDVAKFEEDLATLDSNLKQTILPQLHAALVVNGKISGDIVVMNYYDPFQNLCPNTVPYTQKLNQHLVADVSGFGTIADVFGAFGGATTPNTQLCSYTWICSGFKDIHSTNTGYSVVAKAFENTIGY